MKKLLVIISFALSTTLVGYSLGAATGASQTGANCSAYSVIRFSSFG